MRASPLPILLLLALVAGGCALRPAARPPTAAAVPATPASASALDAIAYGAPRTEAPPVVAAPAPVRARAAAVGGEYVAPPYRLDSGDKLRIVVFGQDGLSNSYTVDAAGRIAMPLIGAVPARGLTPAELSRAVAARLRRGYIREPHVAAEVETYRPFFILGEVTAPGQYAYVPNMTVETAVAIAGGFTPRARRSRVDLTRQYDGQSARGVVPLRYPVQPGDTIVVNERWF